MPYRFTQSYIDLNQYLTIVGCARKRLENAFGHDVPEIELTLFAAESGFLVASNLCSSENHGREHVLHADAGFWDGETNSLYGAYHPISICHRDNNVSDKRGACSCS
ncbi:MAG: hypothetical protein U0930_02190 [Pirellulales bacterium]